ncbi:Cilia- and flagella-associated protein 157 [Caenorhabditis elegans]|uniref:Cilia- and flagella-associated protein 157 n=2 Tax=Caenorhabditis elegans TaxID=6239 RepID=Q95XJ5_CAEEL|nr:Cilia- and flagella-associated protein 157 [Caenorhabditis elegans]CCD74326.1 Cilia- and flagella-associated protein 157 [Caenorhabditis elegans]|eukprot:NP_504160.1 Uncharacterized protein CELE_Y45G5AM.7 [Caenorhabditis elegans]
MDETQRSVPGSNSSLVRDPEIERLAPVSVKGSDKYTAIFQDLKASWKKYTDLEDGERIAAILRDNSVENEVELLSKMSENEIADLFRVKLRKVAILEEENDQLHRRNRDLSHRLHLVEHRVGKAQIVVMEKVEKATGHIIQEFHERELDLARNVEILQEENSNLTAKNEKLEETVDDLHEKVANLETSNKELTEINVDNERKISNSSDEIFSLQDLLGKTKVQLEEETEKVLQERTIVENLKAQFLKERKESTEKIELIQKEAEDYRKRIEEDIRNRQQRHKKEVDAHQEKFSATVNHQNAVIEELTQTVKQKQSEIAELKDQLEKQESRIKGDLKRGLAADYRQKLGMVSSLDTHPIRTPLYENPFYEWNQENRKRNERAQCPPSPQRTLGIQTSADLAPAAAPVTSTKPRQLGNQKNVKFTSSGRLPSHRK